MRRIALDIETDTRVNGLDPRVAAVTEIAWFDGSQGDVLAGEEASMLHAVCSLLEQSDPGVLLSWNGSVFDFPFLDARLKHHRISSQLSLTFDPAAFVKYEPTPGYEGAYTVSWAGWEHVDVSHLYRPVAEAMDVAFSLKPVARAHGLQPIELDRNRMHEYSADERRAYALSDVEVTWKLDAEFHQPQA